MSTRSLLSLLIVPMLACGGAPAKPGANAMSAEPTVSIFSGEPTPTSDDAAPTTADTSKTYPIRLHRNGRVGERARVVLDMVEDANVSAHASRRKSVHKHLVKHLHLECEWTTTALDDHQDELRAVLDVTKLSEDDAVLLKNKRIELTRGIKKEDATLNVDGKPVSAKVRKAVEELTPLRIDSTSSDNDFISTTQPQSVGSHWPINGERARTEILNDNGVSSTAVSGEATLVGVERIGGVDVLRIKVELQIEGMVYPLHHPGATFDPTLGKTVATILYPLDENRGVLEAHTSYAVTARIHVPGPHGGSGTADVDLAAQRDAYATPL